MHIYTIEMKFLAFQTFARELQSWIGFKSHIAKFSVDLRNKGGQLLLADLRLRGQNGAGRAGGKNSYNKSAIFVWWQDIKVLFYHLINVY